MPLAVPSLISTHQSSDTLEGGAVESCVPVSQSRRFVVPRAMVASPSEGDATRGTGDQPRSAQQEVRCRCSCGWGGDSFLVGGERDSKSNTRGTLSSSAGRCQGQVDGSDKAQIEPRNSNSIPARLESCMVPR